MSRFPLLSTRKKFEKICCLVLDYFSIIRYTLMVNAPRLCCLMIKSANFIEEIEMNDVSISENSIVKKPVRKPRLNEKTKSDKDKKPRLHQKKQSQSVNDLTEFTTWLSSLESGVTPTVHVNGPIYTSCVLTVDFGTPLDGIKITTEQSNEMANRLRNVTKAILNRDVKVSIMNDPANGIWWTCLIN